MIGCLQNESASVSASSKSLRFILSLRLYLSYITSGPGTNDKNQSRPSVRMDKTFFLRIAVRHHEVC